MSRRYRNCIDIKDSLELFTAYALQPRKLNSYTFRLKHEEHKDTFYDWFHTTGSIVRNREGYHKNIGVITTPEDAAKYIKEDLIK